MNRRSKEQARLLAEVFHGDWSAGPAARFAHAAAAHARRRRRKHRFFATVGLATLGIVVSLLAVRLQQNANAGAVVAHAKPAYEIISDEELLAQLPDLAVLIEPGGHGGKRYTLLQPVSGE